MCLFHCWCKHIPPAVYLALCLVIHDETLGTSSSDPGSVSPPQIQTLPDVSPAHLQTLRDVNVWNCSGCCMNCHSPVLRPRQRRIKLCGFWTEIPKNAQILTLVCNSWLRSSVRSVISNALYLS